VQLSRKQYVLLAHVYSREAVVCGPEELLKAVYDEDVPPERAGADRRLERLVVRLREKIEEDPRRPRRLIKEPRRGYRLILHPGR
jgi:DNA-binding response OmpR family regulator